MVPHDKFGQDPIWNGRDRLFLAPKSVIRNAMFSQPEPYQGQLVTITLWSPMPSLVKIRSEMTEIGCFSPEISHPECCVQSTGTILRAVGRCPIVVTHDKFGQDPIWNGRHMLQKPFFAVFSPKNGKFENLKKTSRDTWMMILNAEFQVSSPSQCRATGCD